MKIIHYINAKDAKYTKLCFNTWHLDDMKGSRGDNICNVIH